MDIYQFLSHIPKEKKNSSRHDASITFEEKNIAK